ncbi:transcriptional regulator with XRE-family HTH domain [Luteimonas terrae]|uniref:Transcriptional regulator with XRE-family HTH domain n=2 Tax=Luteimonas terrae TaxID=1530191 RepID=A0ABU1XX86_9GAMM|nr:transcriptional regulator with XRE-family HTH domain [Luteimonas terrae]
MNTFGDRMRAARKALGKTQDVIADEIEVTKSAVSAWETNREKPGFDKLPRLRAALETSLDELVCGDAAAARLAQQATAIAEGRMEYRQPDSKAAISPEETRLLRLWRELDAGKRTALLKLLG